MSWLDTVVDWVDIVVDWVDTVVSWLDTVDTVVVYGMPRMEDWLEAVGDLALVAVTALLTLHAGVMVMVSVGLHTLLVVVLVGQRGDDGGHDQARRQLSHDGAGAWLVAVLGWSLERGRVPTDGGCVRSSIYTKNTVRCQESGAVLRTIAVMLLGGVLWRPAQPHHHNSTPTPCCRQSPDYETLHYVCVKMPTIIPQLPPLKIFHNNIMVLG